MIEVHHSIWYSRFLLEVGETGEFNQFHWEKRVLFCRFLYWKLWTFGWESFFVVSYYIPNFKVPLIAWLVTIWYWRMFFSPNLKNSKHFIKKHQQFYMNNLNNSKFWPSPLFHIKYQPKTTNQTILKHQPWIIWNFAQDRAKNQQILAEKFGFNQPSTHLFHLNAPSPSGVVALASAALGRLGRMASPWWLRPNRQPANCTLRPEFGSWGSDEKRLFPGCFPGI